MFILFCAVSEKCQNVLTFLLINGRAVIQHDRKIRFQDALQVDLIRFQMHITGHVERSEIFSPAHDIGGNNVESGNIFQHIAAQFSLKVHGGLFDKGFSVVEQLHIFHRAVYDAGDRFLPGIHF